MYKINIISIKQILILFFLLYADEVKNRHFLPKIFIFIENLEDIKISLKIRPKN